MKVQEIHQLVDEHQEVAPDPPPHTVEHDPFIERTILSSRERPFHQTLTCLTQLSSGPYVVQIWSRYVLTFEPTKPSSFTEWTVESYQPGYAFTVGHAFVDERHDDG